MKRLQQFNARYFDVREVFSLGIYVVPVSSLTTIFEQHFFEGV